jgi:hypothetical protein
VVRVVDVGLGGRSDPEILEWAAREGRVVVSRDRATLSAEAVRRIEGGKPMPGLTLLRRGVGVGRILRTWSSSWLPRGPGSWRTPSCTCPSKFGENSRNASAGPCGATLGSGGSQSVPALPKVYGTSASAEVSVSRSQGSVSWTEVYTLESVSPDQVTVRSYGSASVTAAYTGPLPGTLCYDGSCRQAAPGRYTAPAEEVIRTWTDTYTWPCPWGQTGSVIVTERWRTVKYWTPREGGLSSRGTLRFTSATRDEMVDRTESNNCEPIDPSTPTQTPTAKPPGPVPPTPSLDLTTPPDLTRLLDTGPTRHTSSSPTRPLFPGLTTLPIPSLTTPSGLNPTRPLDLTTLPIPSLTTPSGPSPTNRGSSSSENNNDRGGGGLPLNPSGDFNPRTFPFGLRHEHFRSERPKPRYLLPLPWTLSTQL